MDARRPRSKIRLLNKSVDRSLSLPGLPAAEWTVQKQDSFLLMSGLRKKQDYASCGQTLKSKVS
jgi:hypothetical protein